MNETVNFKDFQKLDIRIGTVTEAVVPEWSHWVMKLTVDLGEEIGTRTIFAGIMEFFKPEDLIGKQLPVVVNLEPKKIGPEGDMSEGMIMMSESKIDVSDDDLPAGEAGEDTPPVLLIPEGTVPNGVKVH